MPKSRKNREPDAAGSRPDSPFVEPVALPTEDSIDLHAFQPKEIPSLVEEYLAACQRAGLRELRIVHGKGTGVQRNIVRSILQRHPNVADYRDAPARAGGWGATIVILARVDSAGSKH